MTQPPGDDSRSEYRASARPRLRSDNTGASSGQGSAPLSRRERIRQERQRSAPSTAAHGIPSADVTGERGPVAGEDGPHTGKDTPLTRDERLDSTNAPAGPGRGPGDSDLAPYAGRAPGPSGRGPLLDPDEDDAGPEIYAPPAGPVSVASSYLAARNGATSPAAAAGSAAAVTGTAGNVARTAAAEAAGAGAATSGTTADAGPGEPIGADDADAPLSRRALRDRQTRNRRRKADAAAAHAPTESSDTRAAGAAFTEDDPELTTGDDGRSRHSTRLGEGFSELVTWTTAGTFLPGSGLIKAGRKGPGLFILIAFLGLIAAGIGWLLWRGPLAVGARMTTSPTYLLAIAIIAALAGLIWIGIMLATYRNLRAPILLSRAQRALGGIMVASLAVIIGVPAGVVSSYALIQRSTISTVFGDATGSTVAAEDLWADEPQVNVLLLGRDDGEDRTGVRPDTILVASIDTATGDSTLISVPRNLNQPIFPSGSALEERFPYGFDAFGPQESMINAVWTWAEGEPQAVDNPAALEPGMWATMQAVEGSLGLELDYYGAVNMKGFEDLVDSIGGVRINVERPIPMGGGTNQNTGTKYPIFNWIDPGEQVLDGYEALWYVRSREGADNYDRMCRQQRMLKTTLDQVDPHEVAMAYPRLAGSATRNIQTDIPQNEVGAFVELALRMQSGEIKSAQINNDVIATGNPDWDELHAWVQEQLDPQEPSQAEEATGEEATEPAPEETEEPAETEPPAPGIETEEGMCFPQGYDPNVLPQGYTPGAQG
ncbi:LCP family protein [Sediminivirga luteola]|uniref:LCP family protein n=1 Tax=Sediminivirga luteola TaxID=1774748 RepID=UPI001F583298|nr:LCP family protein [Sediminivirga luteola]